MQPSIDTSYELNPFDRPGEIAILRPGRSTFWSEDYHTAELFAELLAEQIEYDQPIALGEYRPPLRVDFPPFLPTEIP